MNDFVDEVRGCRSACERIVLGDINDFEFSQTVDILEGGVLTTLMDTLPKAERYSYVFEGNSQVLDQILVSSNLLDRFPIEYDPVHVNSGVRRPGLRPRPAGREARPPARRRAGEARRRRHGGAPLLANSTARLSRMTVTLIWPGYSSCSSISRAISWDRRTAVSSSMSVGFTITRTSRPAWSA